MSKPHKNNPDDFSGLDSNVDINFRASATWFNSDKDLQRIVADRVNAKFARFQEDLKKFGESFIPKGISIKWNDQNSLKSYYEYIFYRETRRLYDDLKEYKKRYPKSDYKKDIEAAKNGNLRRLLRIIQWDKGWLFIDEIKNQILEAQEDGAVEFLRQVGEAIAIKPGIKKPIRNDEESIKFFIVRLFEFVIIYFKLQIPVESSNRILKAYYDNLVKQEYCPEVFLDRDYFMKFLRRHGIIR